MCLRRVPPLQQSNFHHQSNIFFCKNEYHNAVTHVPNFQLSAKSSFFLGALFPSLLWSNFFWDTQYHGTCGCHHGTVVIIMVAVIIIEVFMVVIMVTCGCHHGNGGCHHGTCGSGAEGDLSKVGGDGRSEIDGGGDSDLVRVIRAQTVKVKFTHILTVGQNNQEYRLEYWATCSSVRSFTRTAHSLRSLPRSWDSE